MYLYSPFCTHSWFSPFFASASNFLSSILSVPKLPIHSNTNARQENLTDNLGHKKEIKFILKTVCQKFNILFKL